MGQVKRQHLSTALGGPYLSLAIISREIKQFISVYRNLSEHREGFVLPAGVPIITVPNLCQSDRHFLAFSDTARNERLRKSN